MSICSKLVCLISFQCILFVQSVVSASVNETNASSTETTTTPSDGVRHKRHLSALINMKKAIIGKVFRSSAPAREYKLYRIPGHDNILVKAVPLKVPDSSEVQTGGSSNPTISLLESYLGTNTSNETLKALDGVKNLLGSGILTNDALLNQLLIPIRPPQITYGVPQATHLHPSVFHAPWLIKPQPVKPPCPDSVNIGSVEKPVKVIPEAPILPPLQFLPEVLVSPRPVVVQGVPVPVKEFLDLPRVEIPDYRPVQVSKIPSNPFVHKGHEHLYTKVHVLGKPVYYPGAYSYQQFHNDGTVTQYLDSKVTGSVRPAVLPLPIIERVQVITDQMTQKKPVYVKVPSFSYHQIKNDGSVATFGSEGNIPQLINVRPETLPLPYLIPNNPSAYGPVHVDKINKNPSGFTYHQIHKDGSVTLFGDGSIPLARPAILPTIVTDRVHIISEMMTKPEPKPDVGIPASSPGYSYHQIKNDGSVTTYSGDGTKTDSAIPEPPNRPSQSESNVFGTINTPEFGPVQVQKITKKPSGFPYQQMNTDGPGTIYTDADVAPLVLSAPPKYSSLLLSNRPAPENPWLRPIVHVGKIPEQAGDSYQQLYTGGLGSTSTDTNSPNANGYVPNSRGYSYQQLYSDGTVASYTGPNVQTSSSPAGSHTKPENPGYSYYLIGDHETITTTVGDNDKNPSNQPNFGPVVFPKIPSDTSSNDDKVLISEPPKLSTLINHPEGGGHSGFSYQQSNSDGSVTTFTGTDAVDIDTTMQHMGSQTSPAQNDNIPYVINGAETGQESQQHVSIVDGPNEEIRPVQVEDQPKKPSSSFSYQQTNNDGSVSTYINTDVKVTPVASTEIPAPPSLPIDLPRKPCAKPTKCVTETKVTFAPPVVSTSEYKQIVQDNPDQKFTVVNIKDGPRHESTVAVTATPVIHVTARPAYRRRPRPTSTELPLAEYPIVVPEEAGYTYKQISSDGSTTTSVEGSDKHVTVSLSGEVRRTVQRGDIPD